MPAHHIHTQGDRSKAVTQHRHTAHAAKLSFRFTVHMQFIARARLQAEATTCMSGLPSASLADGVHFEQPSSEHGCLGREMLGSGRQGPDEEGKLGFRPNLQVTSEQAIHLGTHLGFPSTLHMASFGDRCVTLPYMRSHYMLDLQCISEVLHYAITH